MPEDDAEQAVAGAGAGAPCGACRTLRRRCVPGCVFAPYFTASDFAAVHGVFGASNVSKMLGRVGPLPEHRRVAAATLVEEARARAADPTFGRVSYLRILQEVNDRARAQVDEAREEIAREFGALAASQPVDVAAAAPEARVEARAQVDAALKHAREQDARLLGVRNANEVRWRELHPEGTGNAGNGKGIDGKRHREPTMLMPRAVKQQRSSRSPGFPDERSHQQMAAADAEREKALLMRQAAHAKQHGHHLGVQHGETQPPRVTEVDGNGQLHQQMSEAMRSVQAPAAAPPQQLGSTGPHAGTGKPRHAGDAAAGRTPGQGSTSVLLEAMMQLAGAGDGQQQLVAQHANRDYDITQDMMQLQELLDMGERARKQQIMKDDVMMEMGQWDAAAGVVTTEQDVMTMTQQIPINTWQHHNDPAPQYAGMRDQEMPQQMEEASAAELAQTTTGNNTSQQFAWAQQYHDPAAAHHRASPWHHRMADAHQPAAASTSQVAASEQDLLLLLQQHQVAAAESLLSAGGARHFDNLAAQYDDTELTLGYVHPDMHQQPGQVARVQDMNSRHAAAAVFAEPEMTQLAAGAQQHSQNGLDIALGNGHRDAEIQAMLQELAAVLELGGNQRKQGGVTTGMRQWDAASGIAREQDVMTMTQQDDGAWILEKLEQMEKDSMAELAKRLSRQQAETRHAQNELGITLGNGHTVGSTQGNLQGQELFAMAERDRKLEMLMSQVVAAECAREQELITQQAAAAQQQQHPVAQNSEKERKLEMLIKRFVAAERAREQELITQQAAAAQQKQQQHPVAQYSGTEVDISLGQGHGHPYWHQPTVQQMLQEQQLADAVGFGRRQHDTILVQQANGEHGGGGGATMALLSPESAKTAQFLFDQQPQPNGHQMDSSPPPPSSQLHAQVSHQQRTDVGGQGLNSDLAAYLHYESLSRHGLAGNGRFHQG